MTDYPLTLRAPERRDGVQEDLNPLELDGGGLPRIVRGEPVRYRAGPILGLDRRLEERERHRR